MRWKEVVTNVLTIPIVAIFATPIQAQDSNCMPRSQLSTILEERYGESSISAGLSTTGGLFEVFVNNDRSTWTLAVSTPQGLSCVVAVGRDWFDTMPTVPADGA